MVTENDLIFKVSQPVVIKMVRDNQGFQIKCYNEEILGDFLDEAEFNAVI
jgi:hypothetical protein